MEHQINYPKIENAVFNGIKRTINRFRENPFYYFTEADIHSSLHSDIVRESSKIMYYPINDKYRVSIVHQEYPTFFRYYRKALITSGIHDSGIRGHYDLVILDPKVTLLEYKELENYLLTIINKSISTDSYKFIELLYIIEVKYISMFNFNINNIKKEIIIDNIKLSESLKINPFSKVINLIFCTPRSNKINDIEKLRQIIIDGSELQAENILNIFIQSYLDKNELKNTPKPIRNKNAPESYLKNFPEKYFLTMS